MEGGLEAGEGKTPPIKGTTPEVEADDAPAPGWGFRPGRVNS